MENRSTLLSKLKFIAIAGVGQFADGYLNITIGLVVPMIGYTYFQSSKGAVPAIQQDIMKGALSIGMIVGQILFGFFGDAFGRHKIYGKELILTMLGTLMVIVAPTHFSHKGIVAWVAVWRVVTGLGIGGDYPMTASLSAEQERLGMSRSRLILTVFLLGSIGNLCANIIYIILLAGFHHDIDANVKWVQWVWRLLLGLGLVPCILTLYARLRLRETKPYEKFVAKETGLFDKSKRGLADQFDDFRAYFANWRHARTLFAVSFVWFLFDIAFYGVNLNQSVILSQIGYGKGATTWQTLHNTAIGNIIVSAAGYVPGFVAGIFLPDIIGRRRQQFCGCVIVAVLYATWAGVTNHTSTGGLITLFTLSQFFLNAGPSSTTFLIPAEVFPTRVRGTAHGLAAASGKAGAVLTSFAFGTATEAIGLRGMLGLFSGLMAICAALTLWIPEAKGRTLEEIEDDRIYDRKSSSPTVSEVNVSPKESE